MKPKLLAYLQLSLAMTFVGSSVVVGKILTATVPVFLASGLSLLVALMVLVPLLLRQGGLPKMTKSDLGVMFLQALLGTFLYRVFLLYGLRYAGAIESGIITSTGPAVIVVLSMFILKERLSFGKLAGVLLSVLGIMVMHLMGGGYGGSGSQTVLLGSVLVFGSVLGEAMFTILAKPVSKAVTPLVTSTMVALLGLLMFLPFGFYEMLSFDVMKMSLVEVVTTVYYGVFVTAVAFLLWFKGLGKMEASVAGMFTGLIPVSGVVLSAMVLGEKVGLSHLLGGGLILLSIYVITGFPSGNLLVKFAPRKLRRRDEEDK